LDRDIRKQIELGRHIIEPFDPEMVAPSSVDLRVADEFRVFGLGSTLESVTVCSR
jgi:dCTP deaminase